MSKDNFADGFEAPKQQWIKWGKVGDRIKGTLLSKNDSINKLSKGKQTVFEFVAEAGEFHSLHKDAETEAIIVDDKPTALVKGERYLVAVQEKSRKVYSEMRQVKIGQMFIIQYVRSFKTDTGNAKTLEVKIGGMNLPAIAPFIEEKSVGEDLSVESIGF